MSYQINKVGVIGAGTMGGGIAALIAGTGIPVVLLDVPADDKDRNKTVKALWERQRKSSPAALFTPEAANLVTLGNTEDDFDALKECDWIIEVIIEQLAPKQQLMGRIEAVRKPNAIVSSNTSGIPIGSIGATCGDEFRKHFLGTHFFNPPRYLKLLEVIPTADTGQEVIAFIKDFGTNHLGKGVVICKDTPGFIANRIGAFVGQVRMMAAIENEYSVEEVDAITGVLIGNPKTATFRLADLVGLDVIWNVNRNQYAVLVNDESREMFKSPEILNKLIEQKALGNKSGAGFYKTVQTQAGKEFHILNLKTGAYEPPTKPRSSLYGEVKDIEDIGQRIKEIFKHSDDRDAMYLIETTLQILAYAANRVPEICDGLADLDNAMKWGFNSALGPFEMWDAIGVREGAALMREREIAVPRWVDEMLAKGIPSFYQREGAKVTGVYSPLAIGYLPIANNQWRILLSDNHNTPRELKRNVSASLHDIGDGVLCFEFHSKGNTLDTFMYDVGHYALDVLENNGDYRALVIGSQGKDFCLGANIGMFLQAIAAAGGDFKLIEKESLVLQNFLMRFRFARKPVVTAPYQRVLGGGAEVVMAGASVVAAAETYIGLVEVGVGIIPAAGGCKELVRRNVSPHVTDGGNGVADVTPHLAKVFETIAYAKVSESAYIAQQRGFLKSSDAILLNSDLLIGVAKQEAIYLAESNYTAPNRNDKSVWAAGRKGKAVLFAAVDQLRWGKFISAHDALIAKKLAHVLCGGDLSAPQWVTEDYILELEREAFASLLGETKTQERITHMLKYAKPLRN